MNHNADLRDPELAQSTPTIHQHASYGRQEQEGRQINRRDKPQPKGRMSQIPSQPANTNPLHPKGDVIGNAADHEQRIIAMGPYPQNRPDGFWIFHKRPERPMIFRETGRSSALPLLVSGISLPDQAFLPSRLKPNVP